MILEEYVDKGILFQHILFLAERRASFRFYNGIIEVDGEDAKLRFGTEGVPYTYDVIESALESAVRYHRAT